jgi:predicted transcriptional regulator
MRRSRIFSTTLYVRQKIEQGLADADAGRVLSHAEVQQRLAKWLTK